MLGALMYHSLDDSGSPISLSPLAFERHLDWMVANNIQVTPFCEFPREQSQGHQIALTFDDAFSNFLTEAWPRLQDRGLKATLFVVSDRVGQTNRWNDEVTLKIPELPLLDWDELGKLAESGCEIACHTKNHKHLPTLNPREVEEEIVLCLDAIESRVGIRPKTLAYPYGSYDSQVVTIADGLVKKACTTEFALTTSTTDDLQVPRIDAWYFAKPGILESFGTPKFARFVTRRRQLRWLKRALPIFPG